MLLCGEEPVGLLRELVVGNELVYARGFLAWEYSVVLEMKDGRRRTADGVVCRAGIY